MLTKRQLSLPQTSACPSGSFGVPTHSHCLEKDIIHHSRGNKYTSNPSIMASSSENREPASYTKMSQGDVEAIGAHCAMEYCHVLDLLPSNAFPARKCTVSTTGPRLPTNVPTKELRRRREPESPRTSPSKRNPRYTTMTSNVALPLARHS